ncbi:MAG: ComF family protein [Nitrospiraceae bacterium]|nr:ComF family protein [Nitrospiraceae bacterium]
MGFRTKAISRLLDAVMDGFFPSRCPSCGQSSFGSAYAPFCEGCWGGISPWEGPCCDVCREPLDSEHAVRCAACLEEEPAYKRAFVFGLFEGALRTAIHSYKFAPARRLSVPLAGLLRESGLPRADAVTAVPLSKKRLLERGFNQSMLLARHVAKWSGAELLPHALVKKRDTPPQAGLTRKERARNLRGAFLAARGGLTGMTVLLIDDVITTGATVRECSKALAGAGAGTVFVAALARTKR